MVMGKNQNSVEKKLEHHHYIVKNWQQQLTKLNSKSLLKHVIPLIVPDLGVGWEYQ